ncbi:TPA: hypothetical protein ACVU5H_003842 [Vibrio parahaemolyticus]
MVSRLNYATKPSGDAMLPERVIEQTYFQENGYAVTLLIIDPNQEHINLLKED